MHSGSEQRVLGNDGRLDADWLARALLLDLLLLGYMEDKCNIERMERVAS